MKDCLDGRLHQMVAGAKNIDNKPIYGAICTYCGYFIPNMKNYKAEQRRYMDYRSEISNEIAKYEAGGSELEESTDKILHLMQSFLKDTMDNWQHEGHLGNCCADKSAYEILSNGERMLKGE